MTKFLNISTDTDLGGNSPSDSTVCSQKAIKTYVDTHSGGGDGYHPDLFSWQWSDHEISEMQWLRADTFSWQDGTVYSNAYQHLVSDISGITATTETIAGTTITVYVATDGHKVVLADQETNVASIYTATGVAWYYILDTTNQRFKLPRTQFDVVGLRDTVGKYVAPGLPNITGMISMINPAPNDYRSRFTAGSGALKGTGVYSAGRSPSTSETGNGYPNASLDASWSNAIYGNGTTVQAPATQMYLYFYVGNFSQTAIENTAGLNASLFNGKADINLSNAVANASVAAKETIVGWGTPDYSAGVAFSSGVDYQAPSDGFVIASGWTNLSTNSSFYLNGTRIASFIANTGAWLPGIVYCPVRKGDTINITFTQGTYTMNFYPLKGV